jgi:hypothetical protein
MTEGKLLTGANWTPDVVASILGTLLGIHLGLFVLLLEALLPYAPIRAFSLLVVLMAAYAFNRIVFHMELDGRRHFEQAFALLIPATVIFFTGSLLTDAVVTYTEDTI